MDLEGIRHGRVLLRVDLLKPNEVLPSRRNGLRDCGSSELQVWVYTCNHQGMQLPVVQCMARTYGMTHDARAALTPPCLCLTFMFFSSTWQGPHLQRAANSSIEVAGLQAVCMHPLAHGCS